MRCANEYKDSLLACISRFSSLIPFIALHQLPTFFCTAISAIHSSLSVTMLSVQLIGLALATVAVAVDV